MTHEQALATFASERYLLDEMSGPERATFEEHYFSCAECADDVRAGALMRDGARAGLMNERPRTNNVTDMASADRRMRTVDVRPWYRSAAIPWAAAAALALVAGYQTFVARPGRSISQPMALAPVTLRPASRGQEPKVTVASDSMFATLAVDVSSTVSGRQLTYAIQTASGAVVASGTVEGPQPGAPLLLLVPSAEVAPGRYVLLIADGEYPFEVVTQ
jgi:hypothetical protein